MRPQLFAAGLDPLPPWPRPDVGTAIGQASTLSRGTRKVIIQTVLPGELGGVFTLALTRAATPTEEQLAAVGPVDAPVVCELTYGAGGYGQDVEIDWLQGTLITVPSGGLQVIANYPAIAGAKGFDLQLGAILMPGPRAPSAGVIPMARRTLRMGSIAAGASSARTKIPSRGHAASLLLPTPLDFGNVQISWDTNNAAALTGNVLSRARPGGSDEQPIPNGAESFTITNFGAGAVAPIVVFSLAL